MTAITTTGRDVQTSTILGRLRAAGGSRALTITMAIVVVASIVFIAMDGLKLFWIRFVDALANGFVYAAVALALVLIYKATGIINFAQGSMAMFFTFVAWVLAREQSWPVALSILVAMLASAVFAAAFERLFIRPFDPANHLPITIVTIALLSMLDGLAILIWANDPKGFPTRSRRTRRSTSSRCSGPRSSSPRWASGSRWC